MGDVFFDNVFLLCLKKIVFGRGDSFLTLPLLNVTFSHL